MKKVVLILSVLALALAAGVVDAQAAPVLTFTAQTTSGNGTVTPVLTWSTTPAAASCTASGDPAWTGTKAAAGTQTLAAVTSSRTYNMTCTWPAANSVTVTWALPLLNTDGSTLTDLKGVRVYANTTNPPTTMVKDTQSAQTTSATVSPLTAGTWFFAATAYNLNGVESALSNVASKVLSASTDTRSVGITVNPVPMPPTNFTVQ